MIFFDYPHDYQGEEKAKKIKFDPLVKSTKIELRKIDRILVSLDFSEDEEPTDEQIKSFKSTFLNILKLDLKYKFLSIKQRKEVYRWIDYIKFVETNSVFSKNEIDNFITKHGMKKTDMVAALKSGHEIYINGEYIALNAEKLGLAAAKYFLNGKIKNRAASSILGWDEE